MPPKAAAKQARTGAAAPTPTPPPAPAPIRLSAPQRDHCQRLRAILAASPFALDLSGLGCGKTYTASALALDPGLGVRHVVLVAPVSVLGKWQQVRRRHGVPLLHALSFCQLRGMCTQRHRQPQHGLLTRAAHAVLTRSGGGGGDGDDDDRPLYSVTPAFQALVRQEGVLLVVDEMQNIKNATTHTAACCALIRDVCADFADRGPAAARSRVLLMSGTPFDDRLQVLRLLRSVQVLRGPLSSFGRWNGMHGVVDLCRGLDAEATAAALGPCAPGNWDAAAELHAACYRLFQKVLVPARAAEMPPPALRVRVHKANAFFDIDGAEAGALEASVRALEQAAQYDPERCAVLRAQVDGAEQLSQITRAIMDIETAKLGTMALVAAAKLEAFEEVRVVLCVNYTESIVRLRGALARFRPLVLNGEMSGRQRARALELFQAPADGADAHRLLIANLRTCSTGIDLDDKHGERPRYCLASPTYSVIDVHQLSHRFLRMDTRSDSVLHLMYGSNACELGVLNALARKTLVLQDMAQAQVRGGVMFPGSYPTYRVAESLALLLGRRWTAIDWADPSHALVPEFVPFLRARRTIGRAMARAFLDARFAWCRRRLQREFEGLAVEEDA